MGFDFKKINFWPCYEFPNRYFLKDFMGYFQYWLRRRWKNFWRRKAEAATPDIQVKRQLCTHQFNFWLLIDVLKWRRQIVLGVLSDSQDKWSMAWLGILKGMLSWRLWRFLLGSKKRIKMSMLAGDILSKSLKEVTVTLTSPDIFELNKPMFLCR